MRFKENAKIAIPYAGIIQVRFKEYLLIPSATLVLSFIIYSKRPPNQDRICHKKVDVHHCSKGGYVALLSCGANPKILSNRCVYIGHTSILRM